MDKVNEQIKESMMTMLGRLDEGNLSGVETANVVKEVAELYRALSTYDVEIRKLELDERIASDKRKVDEDAVRNEIRSGNRTFWLGVGDIFVRAALGTTSSLFNAAIFQKLLNAEQDTLVGHSTSMKTFLKGGFKIFKSNV